MLVDTLSLKKDVAEDDDGDGDKDLRLNGARCMADAPEHQKVKNEPTASNRYMKKLIRLHLRKMCACIASFVLVIALVPREATFKITW